MTNQTPDPDNWFDPAPDDLPWYVTGREPTQAERAYEAFGAELRRAVDDLFEAPDERVQAESARLRRLAEQIEDDHWRRAAIQRAESLPRLVNPPVSPGSRELAEAQSIEAGAFDVRGTPDERIAEIRRRMARIGELSEQAPPHEEVTILRLNSALGRLISEIQAGLHPQP